MNQDDHPTVREVYTILREARQQIEQRFELQDRAVNAAFAAAKEAVEKAESAHERRLGTMNEFRNAMADQARLFPTKMEIDLRFASVEKIVWGLAAVFATFLISVIGFIITFWRH